MINDSWYIRTCLGITTIGHPSWLIWCSIGARRRRTKIWTFELWICSSTSVATEGVPSTCVQISLISLHVGCHWQIWTIYHGIRRSPAKLPSCYVFCLFIFLVLSISVYLFVDLLIDLRSIAKLSTLYILRVQWSEFIDHQTIACLTLWSIRCYNEVTFQSLGNFFAGSYNTPNGGTFTSVVNGVNTTAQRNDYPCSSNCCAAAAITQSLVYARFVCGAGNVYVWLLFYLLVGGMILFFFAPAFTAFRWGFVCQLIK